MPEPHTRREANKYLLKAKQFAESKHGGKCLSSRYVNARKPLKWQCAFNHETWNACYDAVVKRKRGTWCPTCKKLKSGKSQRLTINHMRAIAQAHGFEFLSERYINSATKYLWGCGEHTWHSTYGPIKVGGGCPSCSYRRGERICRTIFEQIFKLPFPERSGLGLENHEGYALRLDGYCAEIPLAFEHQGPHHDDGEEPYFGSRRSRQDILRQKENDERKVEWCKKNNIPLIVIPEVPKKLSLEEIKAFIIAACRNLGVELPPDVDKISIDFSNVSTSRERLKLEELRKSVATKGAILSEHYLGQNVRVLCKCSQCDATFLARPHNLISGKWCPHCFNRRRGATQRLSIVTVRERAAELSYRVLSQKYLNARTKMKFECFKGHGRETTWDTLKRKPTCRQCSMKEL